MSYVLDEMKKWGPEAHQRWLDSTMSWAKLKRGDWVSLPGRGGSYEYAISAQIILIRPDGPIVHLYYRTPVHVNWSGPWSEVREFLMERDDRVRPLSDYERREIEAKY